jgi:hypothetical protein
MGALSKHVDSSNKLYLPNGEVDKKYSAVFISAKHYTTLKD